MMDRVKVVLPNGGYRVGVDAKVAIKQGTVFELEGKDIEVQGNFKQTALANELIPFDLETAKAGAALVTRDGRKVRFLAHVPEALSSCRVLAYIELESGAREFTESGKAKPHTGEASDLFMAPKPKRTVWVNLYNDGSYSSAGSEADALRFAKMHDENSYVAIAIPIEIDA